MQKGAIEATPIAWRLVLRIKNKDFDLTCGSLHDDIAGFWYLAPKVGQTGCLMNYKDGATYCKNEFYYSGAEVL